MFGQGDLNFLPKALELDWAMLGKKPAKLLVKGFLPFLLRVLTRLLADEPAYTRKLYKVVLLLIVESKVT